MKTTIITCDICKREIPQQELQKDAPNRIVIITKCNSQNPMERITKDGKYQDNSYTADDACQKCMKSLARIIADGIESLANQASCGESVERARTT